MIRYAGPVNDELSNPKNVAFEQAALLRHESEVQVARIVIDALAGADAIKVKRMLGIEDN